MTRDFPSPLPPGHALPARISLSDLSRKRQLSARDAPFPPSPSRDAPGVSAAVGAGRGVGAAAQWLPAGHRQGQLADDVAGSQGGEGLGRGLGWWVIPTEVSSIVC